MKHLLAVAGLLGALLATDARAEDLQARITKIQCLRPATGLNQDAMAFFDGFVQGGNMVTGATGPLLSLGGPKAQALAAAQQGSLDLMAGGLDLARQIDANRSPDDLYVLLDGVRVFPSFGESEKVKGGQTVYPDPKVAIGRGERGVAARHSIQLWEADSGSDDDLLGEVTFVGYAPETFTFQLASKAEDSLYMVEVVLEWPPVHVHAVGSPQSEEQRRDVCGFWSNFGNGQERRGLKDSDVAKDLSPFEISTVSMADRAKAGWQAFPSTIRPHAVDAWDKALDQPRRTGKAQIDRSSVTWTYDLLAEGVTFGKQQVIVPYAMQAYKDEASERLVRWINSPPAPVKAETLVLPRHNEIGDPQPISMPELQPWISCVPTNRVADLNRLLSEMRKRGYLVETPEEAKAAARAMSLSDRVRAGRGVFDIKRAIDAGIVPTTGDLNVALGADGQGDRDVVTLLLDSGARPDRTSLDRAMAARDPALIDKVLHAGATIDANHVRSAIQAGDETTTDLLLSRGGRILGLTESDLSSALDSGKLALATKLVYAGAPASVSMLRKALDAGDAAILDAVADATPPSAEALELALDRNDLPLFRQFAARGARLASNSPVERALSKGQYEIAGLAMGAGGNADASLGYAIGRNDVTAMRVCLDHDARAEPAVTWAIGKNDEAFFTDLLKRYKADPAKALTQAIDKNSEPFATLAIQVGKASPDGPLPAMVSGSRLPWIEFLVRAGADPTKGVATAVEARNVPVLERLVALGAHAGEAAFVRKAAENGHVDVLKVLIEQAKGKPDDGLGVAVDKDLLEVARYLLDKGAKPAGVNVPAARGLLPMTRLLVEAGGDPNEGVRLAVQNNHTEVAVFLLDAGASTHELLPIAATKDNVVIATKLLDKGANAQEGLMTAVEKGKAKVATLLLDRIHAGTASTPLVAVM